MIRRPVVGRHLPDVAFARMADVTDADGPAVSLERQVLAVVPGHGRGVQCVRRTVAGGAEDLVALVPHAVEVAAAEDMLEALALSGVVVTVLAFGQGVGGPGVLELVLGDPLVQVTMAVGAPEPLVLVLAAIAGHAVARMTVVAVPGNVGIILGHGRAFGMELVDHLGKGLGRGGVAGNARGRGLAHGRVQMTLRAADRSAQTIAVGIDLGKIDVGAVLLMQHTHHLERVPGGGVAAMVLGHLEMAVTAAAKGHRYHGLGCGQQFVAVLVKDLDLGGEIGVAPGPVDRIEGVCFRSIGIQSRKCRNTGNFPPAVLGLHGAAQGGAGQPLDPAVIAQEIKTGKEFGTELEPALEIGVVFQALVGVLQDPVFNPDVVGIRQDVRVLSLPFEDLGPQGVEGRQHHKGLSAGTGTVHSQVIVGQDNDIPGRSGSLGAITGSGTTCR